MTKKYIFGVVLNLFAVIMFFVPFGILFFAKYDEWVTVAEGTSISAGVMIGLVYGILVLRGALKDMSPKITTLISMGVFLAVVYFLDSIMSDLFWIVLSLMGGYVFFLIFSAWGKRTIELAKIYGDEKMRVVARTDDISGIL